MRKWLIAIGVAIGAAILALFRIADGTPKNKLLQLELCIPVEVACGVRVSGELLGALGGADGGRGHRYRRVTLNARNCAEFDAGIVLTDKALYVDGGWRPGLEVIEGYCKILGDAGIATDFIRELPHECGCRAASGVCRVRIEDGGTEPAPFGATLGPGYFYTEFAGAGCVRKACVEIAGESSWPDACPGGD